MIVMRRRLACCNGNKEISMDFDDQQGIMTYNGLESYILNSESYHDNESCTCRGDDCVTNSFDEEEDNSSSSSSNNASASCSSLYTVMKNDDHYQKHEWNSFPSPTKQHLSVKEKPVYHTNQYSDIETLKEKFAKLLLGEDTAGGTYGISSALALSNAISNLATSVFGELWKLEPLSDQSKGRWRREMDWLLSPTYYMIELVPANQNGSNGRIIEIMTPKARADIDMNLPALRKLDSMLIETLDSMIGTEFWYAEVGRRAEGKSKSAGQSKRWWLPSPVVPKTGLSEVERKRLLHYGKLVYQVFKAAKSINENVLDEMAVPTMIKDALPKSGKANTGREIYGILTSESTSLGKMIERLNLKSEHDALEAINRLEAALFVWKETISEHTSGKPQSRTPWSFVKDKASEIEKVESLVKQAEILLQQLKIKYPNIPQTFLDITKIRYGKDLGHAILESYSRVVANLAFKILSRIGDILEEDVTSNPNSPIAISQIVGARIPGISDSPMLNAQ